MPTFELPPVVELTDHVTAVLLVPVTVAVNCCVPDVERIAEVKFSWMFTTAGGGVVVVEEFFEPPPQLNAGRISANANQRLKKLDSVSIRSMR